MYAAVMFGAFALLLFLKIPIPFALGLSTILTVVAHGRLTLMVVAQRMVTSMESYALLAIPLFILTGELIVESGAGRKLVRFANSLVGHITGGLAHTNILASMFFGGISGAASADTAAIGSILIPTMSESGYSKTFATVVTITSSPIGIIIPPSIAMVIFGWMAGVSIPRLFAAGFVPGVLVGLMLMALSYIISKQKGYGVNTRFSLREVGLSFIDALPALTLPLIILGGIFGGIFTATEAAAVAAVGALAICLFVYRQPGLREIGNILTRAAVTSGGVILLIAMTNGFAWVMTMLRIPVHLSQFFIAFSTSPVVFSFSVIIIALIIGLFLPPTAALVVLVPILFPVSQALGMAPVHFGVLLIAALGMGHATPPVGLCLYVGSSISGIPIADLIRPMLPFIGVLLLLSILIAVFPGIVMFIPDLFF